MLNIRCLADTCKPIQAIIRFDPPRSRDRGKVRTWTGVGALKPFLSSNRSNLRSNPKASKPVISPFYARTPSHPTWTMEMPQLSPRLCKRSGGQEAVAAVPRMFGSNENLRMDVKSSCCLTRIFGIRKRGLEGRQRRRNQPGGGYRSLDL